MEKIRTALQPWLQVQNSAKASEFYKKAFGVAETYRMETPDGGLIVKLSLESAEFWVSGHLTDTGDAAPWPDGGETIKLVLVVNDPDKVFEEVIKLGAKEIFPVGEDYGWRLGRIEDPFGFHWEIGRQLNDEK